MQKTSNYQLNQWETTDKLSRRDFNADNAAIDAALSNKAEKSAVSAVETALANYKTSNDAALANKADTSAITALQTQMESKGNCKIFHGSYVGTGTYGAGNLNTLAFEFQPLVVVITGGDSSATFLSGMATVNTSTVFTWSGNMVSWYNKYSTDAQFNESGRTYYYAAVGV